MIKLMSKVALKFFLCVAATGGVSWLERYIYKQILLAEDVALLIWADACNKYEAKVYLLNGRKQMTVKVLELARIFLNIRPSSAEVTMTPSTETALDKETAEKFIRMIDLLEDLNDVQNVYHNDQIPDDLEM